MDTQLESVDAEQSDQKIIPGVLVGDGVGNKIKENYTGLGSTWASQVTLVVKSPPAGAGQMSETRVPFLGEEDPLEDVTANPLQYSCLDRGAWRAIIHKVAKSQT